MEYSNNELVKSVMNGHEHAIQFLYKKYAAALLGLITNMVNSKETAEFVLSQAFVEICQSISQYDSERQSLFTWMVQITRKKVLDQKKQEQDVFKTEVLPNRLSRTVPLLSDNLLYHIYLKGRSLQEVSEGLNISVNDAKTRLREEVLKLR